MCKADTLQRMSPFPTAVLGNSSEKKAPSCCFTYCSMSIKFLQSPHPHRSVCNAPSHSVAISDLSETVNADSQTRRHSSLCS